jgi:hypothetical protein
LIQALDVSSAWVASLGLREAAAAPELANLYATGVTAHAALVERAALAAHARAGRLVEAAEQLGGALRLLQVRQAPDGRCACLACSRARPWMHAAVPGKEEQTPARHEALTATLPTLHPLCAPWVFIPHLSAHRSRPCIVAAADRTPNHRRP